MNLNICGRFKFTD